MTLIADTVGICLYENSKRGINFSALIHCLELGGQGNIRNRLNCGSALPKVSLSKMPQYQLSRQQKGKGILGRPRQQYLDGRWDSFA